MALKKNSSFYGLEAVVIPTFLIFIKKIMEVELQGIG